MFPRILSPLALTFLAACTVATPLAPTTTPAGPRTLMVMTHDSFAVSDTVVKEFENAHNAKVQFLKAGDAGAALNKAILAKGSPLADVFYGVDNTFLSRALAEQVFLPYAAPALGDIPAAFKLDATNSALPVDYGDVCINYDKAWFKAKSLTPPASFEALLDPQYKDLLVVENPASSSPGLAFLLATIAHFGPEKYLDFWADLRANGVKVVDGLETAYYTEFSGSSGQGSRPLVVSYASSPPAEIIFAADPKPAEAPTASLVGPHMCFRQIEFVGILQGTQQLALAQAWVDFMLSPTFQNDLPLQMFVFPVHPQAQLPTEFTRWAQTPQEPATLTPAEIAQNREAWIEAWTNTVLK